MTLFGRKLEYLWHCSPGWTATDRKSLPEPRIANITVKNDVFQKKKLGGERIEEKVILNESIGFEEIVVFTISSEVLTFFQVQCSYKNKF